MIWEVADRLNTCSQGRLEEKPKARQRERRDADENDGLMSNQ
jgi:hypothetical protein